MHELHQEFPTTLAAIAWHTGDVLEFPGAGDRTSLYGVTGFPTAEFDGIEEVVGGYTPTSYPYYLPVFEQRMNTPVNFNVEFDIIMVDDNDFNIYTSFEIIEGTNEENLAAFVVLTETDVQVAGEVDQVFVARSVWPDATIGHALDFSSQSLHQLETTITVEDDYIFENCEVVVFLQNMDTKEIYQGNSAMLSDLVGINDNVETFEVSIYPNPASDRVNINASSNISNIEVYNYTGQLVYKTDARSNIVNFNTSQFESGMYIFKIQTAQGMFVESVIIK